MAIGQVEQRMTRAEEQAPHCADLVYFSCLADVQTFIDLTVGEMDGAAWLQQFPDVHRPNAVRVHEFPHAAEQLADAADALFGAGSSLWQWHRRERLQAGGRGPAERERDALDAGARQSNAGPTGRPSVAGGGASSGRCSGSASGRAWSSGTGSEPGPTEQPSRRTGMQPTPGVGEITGGGR